MVAKAETINEIAHGQILNAYTMDNRQGNCNLIARPSTTIIRDSKPYIGMNKV